MGRTRTSLAFLLTICALVTAAPVTTGPDSVVPEETAVDPILDYPTPPPTPAPTTPSPTSDEVTSVVSRPTSASMKETLKSIVALRAYCGAAEGKARDFLEAHYSGDTALVNFIVDFAQADSHNIVTAYAKAIGMGKHKFGGINSYLLDNLNKAVMTGGRIVTQYTNGHKAEVILDHNDMGFKDTPDYFKKLGGSVFTFSSLEVKLEEEAASADAQAAAQWLASGSAERYQSFEDMAHADADAKIKAYQDDVYMNALKGIKERWSHGKELRPLPGAGAEAGSVVAPIEVPSEEEIKAQAEEAAKAWLASQDKEHATTTSLAKAEEEAESPVPDGYTCGSSDVTGEPEGWYVHECKPDMPGQTAQSFAAKCNANSECMGFNIDHDNHDVACLYHDARSVPEGEPSAGRWTLCRKNSAPLEVPEPETPADVVDEAIESEEASAPATEDEAEVEATSSKEATTTDVSPEVAETSLAFPADGQQFRLINRVSARAVYANTFDGESWTAGTGAATTGDSDVWEAHLQEGGGYRIVNVASNRALFAQADKQWSNGVGAAPPDTPHYADQVWNFVKDEETGSYQIINKYSGRKLYAQAPDNGNGFGAGPEDGESYADTYWSVAKEVATVPALQVTIKAIAGKQKTLSEKVKRGKSGTVTFNCWGTTLKPKCKLKTSSTGTKVCIKNKGGYVMKFKLTGTSWSKKYPISQKRCVDIPDTEAAASAPAALVSIAKATTQHMSTQKVSVTKPSSHCNHC